MHTDPIADLLTRIRNGLKAHHVSITAPYSKFKESLLKVLKEKGFIEEYKIQEDDGKKTLSIDLNENRKDLILKRVSKPGQRIYLKKDEIKPIKNGLGITIISTSKGLITNSEAKKMNIGGEVICEIY